MSAVSNTSWGNQTQILRAPAPAPSICTITFANGVSVPAPAFHNKPATQDFPLHDASYTAHIDLIPLSPSNHAPFEHFDENTIWRWMDIPPPPRTPSPPQPTSPEIGCSSTAVPVPPPTPLSQGSQTRRRKGTAGPKSQVAPTNMTFVFQTRLHGGSSSSKVRANETLSPSTSTPSSGSSLVHRTPSSSRRRRDPRCTCSLPGSDWVRHWRRSCPHNPDRCYPCPKGCGRKFSRKDNAKRHVKLGECPLLGDNEPSPERPPDIFSSSSGFSFVSVSSFSSASSSSPGSLVSPSVDLFSDSSSPSI